MVPDIVLVTVSFQVLDPPPRSHVAEYFVEQLIYWNHGCQDREKVPQQ
jgi:hypothetical protein